MTPQYVGVVLWREIWHKLGMQFHSPATLNLVSNFKAFFRELIPESLLAPPSRSGVSKAGRPPALTLGDWLMGLIFQCIQGGGNLAETVKLLTGKQFSKSSISERRQGTDGSAFSSILKAALKPKATQEEHPLAFYRGLRLVAIDGTEFSVTNTPQILACLSKAATRRMKAAFAKIRTVMLVELGVHNPMAAAIGGKDQESEMELAKGLISEIPEGCLLIADRLYGVGSFIAALSRELSSKSGHFLVRVRSNLKPKLIEILSDGSALMEVKPSKNQLKGKILVREIRGSVRRPGCAWVEVRFWTSLLDAKQFPAVELLALYIRRWEMELVYKQLKVDMRQSELLRSHTVITASQEIAALIIAHAILAQQRLNAARTGAEEVLRISFGKTLALVKSLWVTIAAGEGILSAPQVEALTQSVLRLIAETALPPRRARSCPRAVRQPVGSWPRLSKNTCSVGATEYQLFAVHA